MTTRQEARDIAAGGEAALTAGLLASTASAAELDFLDTAVAGTAVASKAAVLGANKDLDTLRITKDGFLIDATAVTCTAAELNKLDGVTLTTAQINLTLQGNAAGYKIARGTVGPSSGTETVVTGLATVVAASASLKSVPVITHMWSGADIGDQAGSPAAGSIIIRSQKPTATGDVTPIVATTPFANVDWIAVGT